MQLPFRLPIPDDFLLAIAHVVTQWAYLEAHIDRDLAAFRTRPECADMTTPLMKDRFAARMRQWRDMASAVYTSAEDQADILYIHLNATNIKSKRDDVAHNPFAMTGIGLMLIEQKQGQILALQEFKDGAMEVERIAERISLINARCMSFETRHYDAS